MAGGIDWFRWHHGTAGDRKFPLVAKRAGARIGDVVTMWAILLEQASASEDRGHPGHIDFEAIDLALDMPDGMAERIHGAMVGRNLIDQAGRLAAWDKRQPKREREDDGAAERKRRQRERDAELEAEAARQAAEAAAKAGSMDGVTPSHAKSRQVTPREEESRGELFPSPGGDGGAQPPAAPPATSAPEACPHEAIIAAFHECLPMARRIRDWTPARAQALKARWREDRKRQSIEWWRRFFAYCAKSRFLTGQITTAGRKPFELSLDWLVKSENFAKVREGAYHEQEPETTE